MTDPTQAVEVLARAFSCDTEEEWAGRVNFPDAAAGAETFREVARALLAEIAPLLVAEEREACAKVAGDAAAARKLEHALAPKTSEAYQFALHRMREASAIADAIRERGRG